MEDFAGAHEARCIDVDTLRSATPPRWTAAAHLGGSAVECRLKALILVYHGIPDWGQASQRRNDPRSRQPIDRPGHSLLLALRMMNSLYTKAKADPALVSHLDRVTHPLGANVLDFIDLRYAATDLTERQSRDWHDSYRYVLGWLRKNEKTTP